MDNTVPRELPEESAESQEVTMIEQEPALATPVSPVNTPAAGSRQSTSPVPSSAPEAPKHGSSAGLIILQWLTYAFWGWTLLSLVWLMFIVFASVMTSIDTSDMVPYAIAATLVLLPLSLVCDIFYGRHEPVRKTGAAMVVMVIHAVIFALFGIGMLISSVLTLVQMAIGSSGIEDFQTVWLWTSLMSALLYAFTFLRTLNPSPKLKLVKVFPIGMATIVGLFIIFGFMGPVAQASLVKDDRDIEQSLGNVSSVINRYISENERLPDDLAQVSLSGGAKDIVDRGLVVYKAEGLEPAKGAAASKTGVQTTEYQLNEYRYQLCVEYKKAKNESYYNTSYLSDEYSGGVSTYGHPAGNVCYKLKNSY